MTYLDTLKALKGLSTDILQSLYNPRTARHIMKDLEIGRGSDRVVYDLGNGYVAKIDTDNCQTDTEVDIYSRLANDYYYPLVTKILTTSSLRRKGVVLAEKVTPFSDYMSGLAHDYTDDSYLRSYGELEGSYYIDELEDYIPHDSEDFARLVKVACSLDDAVEWAFDASLADIHIDNFGIRDCGEVVMLDLGYGSDYDE